MNKFFKGSIIAVLIMGIGAVQAASLRKIEDPKAYEAGEKVGELILQQWIQLAKKNITEVITLSQKVAELSKNYSEQLNKSFIMGNIDCLKKKNVKLIAEKAQLDKHGCARVLACYYYWHALLSAAITSGAFDFGNPEDKEQEALERAAREVYGIASPEIVGELKKSLEADEELEIGDSLLDTDDGTDDEDEE